ncbi:MAG: DUF2937 family protein, partial [Flavobacteriaceae bacterium]|nr:DUF2937 family protein [Flavobacteriaceae bacterium]
AVVSDAWDIFEPAVPLNVPGAIYGGAGALLFLLLARFGVGTARYRRRRRNDRKLGLESPPEVQPSGEIPRR